MQEVSLGCIFNGQLLYWVLNWIFLLVSRDLEDDFFCWDKDLVTAKAIATIIHIIYTLYSVVPSALFGSICICYVLLVYLGFPIICHHLKFLNTFSVTRPERWKSLYAATCCMFFKKRLISQQLNVHSLYDCCWVSSYYLEATGVSL